MGGKLSKKGTTPILLGLNIFGFGPDIYKI